LALECLRSRIIRVVDDIDTVEAWGVLFFWTIEVQKERLSTDWDRVHQTRLPSRHAFTANSESDDGRTFIHFISPVWVSYNFNLLDLSSLISYNLHVSSLILHLRY
jgi:hypothetical protein